MKIDDNIFKLFILINYLFQVAWRLYCHENRILIFKVVHMKHLFFKSLRNKYSNQGDS
jgi:hypothetical protein